MKSKTFKKTAFGSSALLLAIVTVAATGCAHRDRGEKVDSIKTQLMIKNYQGGFGNKWLYAAKERYEALHAEDSYEDGKKGVQVLITDQKSYPNAATIKNDAQQVYFFESLDYNTFLKENSFADITKYVTGANPYESGKTIESKLYDTQKDFFGVQESDGQKHYYAIPHYIGSFGIAYNKAVFDKKNFYFCDGYENEVGELRFIQSSSEKKSAGPNGIYGDYDDGMPVTYADFFELCGYIKDNGAVPFTYYEKGDYNYLGFLACALASDHDGLAKDMVNYTMDGQMTVAKMNSDMTDVLYNEDGTIQTENVTVTPELGGNGYEVQRAAGKYYGMSFLRQLLDGASSWKCNVVTSSDSQYTVQDYFINSQFGRLPAYNEQKNQPIAMMFEGNWWYSEASDTLSSLPEVEKTQLNYGWMPLPRANNIDSNTKATTLDCISSMCFVKAGLDPKIEALAGDFVQYMNTDEALREFTVLTNSVKGLKYDMGDRESDLSTFGLSFWNYTHNSDLILPVSRNAQFAKYLSNSQMPRRYNYSSSLSFPTTDFKADKDLSAGNYLAKMYKWYKESVWNA